MITNGVMHEHGWKLSGGGGGVNLQKKLKGFYNISKKKFATIWTNLGVPKIKVKTLSKILIFLAKKSVKHFCSLCWLNFTPRGLWTPSTPPWAYAWIELFKPCQTEKASLCMHPSNFAVSYVCTLSDISKHLKKKVFSSSPKNILYFLPALHRTILGKIKVHRIL